MANIKTQRDKLGVDDTFNVDLPVRATNRSPTDASNRLKEAVGRAGGRRSVAEQANVKLASLDNYLGGRRMPADVANRLAEACGVSVGWLISGQGSPDPDGLHLAVGPEQPFSTLKIRIEWLASAMEEADRLIEERNLEASYAKKAQLIWVLYEIIGARETALIHGDSSTPATAERKNEV